MIVSIGPKWLGHSTGVTEVVGSIPTWNSEFFLVVPKGGLLRVQEVYTINVQINFFLHQYSDNK